MVSTDEDRPGRIDYIVDKKELDILSRTGESVRFADKTGTQQMVYDAISSSSPVVSVNGKTGAVVITSSDLGISEPLQLKGQVPDEATLQQITGMSTGDVYQTSDTGSLWAYAGSEWVDLGPTEVDLSDYYKKTEANDLLGRKADKAYVDSQDQAQYNLLTAMIDSHTNEYALTKQQSTGKITTYGEGELGEFDLAAFHGSDNGNNYFTKSIGMSGQKITNMADGSDDTDASTVGQMKEYVSEHGGGVAFVPDYINQQVIPFSGWQSGGGNGQITSGDFIAPETGWYFFYYSCLLSVNQPWSVSTDLLVDGEIVDVNWFTTQGQENAGFVIPMRLVFMEKDSVAVLRTQCGAPVFGIRPNGNSSVVLFYPPKAVLPEFGITDAPTDGKPYARQDGAWSEISGEFTGTTPPQMIQRSVTYTDTSVNIIYAFKGDTTGKVFASWTDMLYGNQTAVNGVYIPAPSDQTMYMISIPNEYLTNTPAAGSTVGLYTTSTFDTGTRIWYETFHVQESLTESDPVAMAIMPTKADIYYLGPKELTTLKVGDDVGGKFINFDIPDFSFSEDADGGYAQYDAITFSDGSRIRFENSSWYYMAAQEGISLPTIIHTIVEGGNYWTDSSFTLPDGITITAIDPRWVDSPMSKGHIQDSAADTETIKVDCEYNYDALQNHIENDKGYWATLLEVQNKNSANQALLTQQQTTINDLLVRVSTLEDAPIPAPPTYDMSNPQVLKTPPLLGLLGLEIGGQNEIGDGWTAPSNGLVVIDGASAIGLLTPTWIAVNGEKVDPSNPLAVLTLIGGGSSGQFTVNAGDVITESGMGNVTYYEEVS